jgi:hypothetical protein
MEILAGRFGLLGIGHVRCSLDIWENATCNFDS